MAQSPCIETAATAIIIPRTVNRKRGGFMSKLREPFYYPLIDHNRDEANPQNWVLQPLAKF